MASAVGASATVDDHLGISPSALIGLDGLWRFRTYVHRMKPSDGVTVAPRGALRLFTRWFAILCLPATVTCAASFSGALKNSGNLTVPEQSVEWLRGHHLGDAVSWVESEYYAHHQPQRGGTLAGGLPVAVSNATTTTITGSGPAAPTTPDGITPMASNPLPGEGVWSPLGDTTSNGAVAMQAAYLRPDDVHGTVLAAVVRIDQAKASFRLIPGATEPGHGPWSSGNAVPHADLPGLLAAFNSGFRIADARGGFMAEGRTVGQLREGAASFVIAADGSLDVVKWTSAVAASRPVAVRQNLDLIVDGGKLVGGLDDNTADRWGKTVGNTLLVWRSGLGVDATGRILYVASAGLSVRSLAVLLQRAGAVRAMELDINHAWVSFNAFHHGATGSLAGTKLIQDMSKPASRYLGPDSRDFVAVFARPSRAGL